MYFSQASSLSPGGLCQGLILSSTVQHLHKLSNDGIQSTLSNFTADAKLDNEVNPSEGRAILERNPDRLKECAGKSRVKTNVKSCIEEIIKESRTS